MQLHFRSYTSNSARREKLEKSDMGKSKNVEISRDSEMGSVVSIQPPVSELASLRHPISNSPLTCRILTLGEGGNEDKE